MSELFSSGRLVDGIIALMVVEGAGLALYFRRTGHGVPLAGLAINLVAGAALMLALRGALVGAHWTTIALCLAGALIAHLIDVWYRWR